MRRLSVPLFLAIIALAQTPAPMPWLDPKLPAAVRAKLLIEAMTLDEKIEQIALKTGANPALPNCGQRRDTRHLEGIPRLGIPTFRYTNGPIGVAGGDCEPNPPTTAVPTALLVAATWDADASNRWGEIAGVETFNIAHHVFEAPGINLGRIPQAGRNFEYFGEDPFLSGSMAVAQVKGIQAHGTQYNTQASIKHFVANEQETDRTTMNTIVDDRTLHELYMLPFEMAIRDAKPAAIICSYPKVGGLFACESPQLLNGLLRKQLGFEGYVISDRKAVHSTAAALKSGLDLEFDTTPVWFTPEKVKAALAAGEASIADIDAMLSHRYITMFSSGQFDHPVETFSPVDFSGHALTALNIALQGCVLLKNDKVLPLGKPRSIALIGAVTFAGKAKLPTTGPRGTITVNSPKVVTPLEGLTAVLKALDPAGNHTVTYDDGTNIARAQALAAQSEVAIVMAGDISIEGADRANLSLPLIDGVQQDDLISAVASANPRTIVVLKDGGPVLMPWLNRVAAVLEAWYPGQADGTAVADLLFGVVSPSGKLPVTFPKSGQDGPIQSAAQFPGVMVDGVRTVTYLEGLEMGYRWYEAHHVMPQFPFGFGLAYTTFAITGLAVDVDKSNGTQPLHVTFDIQNTGGRAGSEVAQLYLTLPASTGEPPKRLVGFKKVLDLEASEKRKIEITIDPGASNHPLSFWDSRSQSWVMANGTYTLSAGNSSANTPAETTISIQQ